jgi:hypothetical protein
MGSLEKDFNNLKEYPRSSVERRKLHLISNIIQVIDENNELEERHEEIQRNLLSPYERTPREITRSRDSIDDDRSVSNRNRNTGNISSRYDPRGRERGRK